MVVRGISSVAAAEKGISAEAAAAPGTKYLLSFAAIFPEKVMSVPGCLDGIVLFVEGLDKSLPSF